jgi:hypothetical protein
MTKEQQATKLYRIAYQCALNKRYGCNQYCGNCRFNASLYVDNPREAVLIKTTAEIDENKSAAYNAQQEAESKAWTIFGWVIVGIVVLLFLWGCYSCKSCMGS